MEVEIFTNNEFELDISGGSDITEEVNIGETASGIDVVKVDNTPLPIINKSVNIDLATPLSQKADKNQIPTKTSQLRNDSGYITKDVNNLTYYTKTSDLPAPITVDTALNASSTNPVQNAALYPAIVPTEVGVVVAPTEWTGPSGTGTYNTIGIITLPSGSFTDNSLVELVFKDQFDIFAKHGFMLYGTETSTQRVWLNSIGKPTSSINFTFRIWKWGN